MFADLAALRVAIHFSMRVWTNVKSFVKRTVLFWFWFGPEDVPKLYKKNRPSVVDRGRTCGGSEGDPDGAIKEASCKYLQDTEENPFAISQHRPLQRRWTFPKDFTAGKFLFRYECCPGRGISEARPANEPVRPWSDKRGTAEPSISTSGEK